MRSILVPVDGSEGSRHAAVFAARLARATGAKLTLMHVYDIHSASSLGLRALSREDMGDLTQRKSRASIDAALEAIGDTAGLEIERDGEIGDPATEIMAKAKRSEVELIVMGSRGLSPVKELLLGSVSDRVMRGAPCPVTVVR
ncbi:MAG: universal stress protein [Myxococcales bacterium]|nr:universal stress protein [Myxococcales bacterium]